MDINDIHEIFRLTSVGLSRQAVASRLGVAKSTVQRYLEIIKSAGLTPEQASATTTAELEPLICSEPGVRAGFVRPDFEWVYSRHHVRGKNRKTLRELWQNYVDQASDGAKTLGYKGFCKSYERFCSGLPASCREVALTRLDHRSRGLRPTFEGERPREPWTSLHRGIFCANPRRLWCQSE